MTDRTSWRGAGLARLALRAATPEQVVFQRFEVENVEKRGHRVGHSCGLAIRLVKAPSQQEAAGRVKARD